MGRGRGQQTPDKAQGLLFGRRQQAAAWDTSCPSPKAERQARQLVQLLLQHDWLPTATVLNRYRDAATTGQAPLIDQLLDGLSEYLASQAVIQLELDDELSHQKDVIREQRELTRIIREQLQHTLQRQMLDESEVATLTDPQLIWLSDEIGPLAEIQLERYQHASGDIPAAPFSFLIRHSEEQSPSVEKLHELTLNKLVAATESTARKLFEPWGIEDQFSQKVIILRRKNAGASLIHLRHGPGVFETVCGIQLKGARRVRRGAWSGNLPVYKCCPTCQARSVGVLSSGEDEKEHYTVLPETVRHAVRQEAEIIIAQTTSADPQQSATATVQASQAVLVEAVLDRLGEGAEASRRILKSLDRLEARRLQRLYGERLSTLTRDECRELMTAWFAGRTQTRLYELLGAEQPSS